MKNFILFSCICVMQQYAAEDEKPKQRQARTTKFETLHDLAQKASRKKRTPVDKGHQVAEQQKETALSLSDFGQIEQLKQAAQALLQLKQNQPVESSTHDT